jgi:hypothetical protein
MGIVIPKTSGKKYGKISNVSGRGNPFRKASRMPMITTRKKVRTVTARRKILKSSAKT